MASPRVALTTKDQLQWRYAQMDAEVTCANTVLESIRLEAVEGLTRVPHGGLEIGGILLGRRTAQSMEIVAAVPIKCEHKLGPLFILSSADERALEADRSNYPKGALQPVALYVSHARRGFLVSDSDSSIIDRHFPEMWQMALVIMPSKTGASRMGFFVRESIERPFVCVHEISLLPQENRVPHASEPTAAASSPHPEPAPATVSPSAAEPSRSFLRNPKKYLRLSQWNLPASLVLLLLTVFGGGWWVRAHSGPEAEVPMHISDLGPNLRIEWDPAKKAVRTASAATLEIRDGGRKPLAIPITRAGLDTGSVLYVPQSDNIEVSLKLMHRNGLTSQSVIFFVNPSRPVEPSTPSEPSEPPKASGASEVALASKPVPANTSNRTPAEGVSPALPSSEPSPSPASAQPAMSISASDRPTASALAKPDPFVSHSTVEEKRPARKVFHSPQQPPGAEAQRHLVTSLPDAPNIAAGAPFKPALPFNSPSLAALLAPESRLTGPPQIRTGHLIWTGSLRKNAELSISSDGATKGVLSGRLPGVPVKVTLQPAELVDGGIAVFSKDPQQLESSEQPQVWNGWKIVTYDWDAKRIVEADIIEPPGPPNNWKRLVLRNGNHSASVLVVNWQRISGQ